MNRAEFMRQLERLLQSVPAAEREEALQYYNDYFDDAGDESEQDVIEALGNPARVAENIKRDLLESGYGETPVKKALASERKVIEYGKQYGNQYAGQYGVGSEIGNAAAGGSIVPAYVDQSGQSGHTGKSGLPGWVVALIIVGLVFGSPVVAGVAGTLFGAIATWFCLILVMGMVAAALFIVLVVLVVVGIMCMPTDPVAGIALVGGGLLCGSLGILFLMLTVAMAGIITPAIFKGIAFLLRKCFPRKKV